MVDDTATRSDGAGIPPQPATAHGLGQPLEAPSIALPKGGGAIRGLGEKLAIEPSTGTASLSVPVPVSPGRDGMQPQLALAYDSAAGNGPFGLGWSVATGAIARKTDKRLPRYRDRGPDADVYVLSGAEDLVPLLDPDAGWTHPAPSRTLPDGSAWVVERYRPRIERLFARIERWTPAEGGAPHWRSISNAGVVSRYGTSPESRIADPGDPARVFSWLISETYDAKGNAMCFRYVAEDATGVDATQAHERNRSDAERGANRYLKRVLYGNATPRADGEDLRARTDWLFELVLDYGEHDLLDPIPAGDGGAWAVRADPFSSRRAGFDVRTYRLCRRLLMFHHFPGEPGVGADCLVRSLDLGYDASPVATTLKSIAQSGYRRDGAAYVKRSFPPLELAYAQAQLQSDVREIDAENLPQGAGGPYRLVDLDAEGLPGILTEQGDAWRYKRNVSPLTAAPDDDGRWSAAFAALETVATRPSASDLAGGQQQLLDLDGDGRIELAQFDRPLPGSWSRTADSSWDAFQPFASLPNLAWDDPRLLFADLTGDGRADALALDDRGLRWHPSLGALGFGAEERVLQPSDEERGPRLLHADATQSIHLADLSGDGLADLVRVRDGEVCYWPNLGYGRFGAKVAMDDAPAFEAFDPRRVRLADVDGSGPVDLVYLGADGVRLHANEAGNRLAAVELLDDLPTLAEPASVAVLDLLGNGTACLVWSSALPGDTRAPLRYVDLMGGVKPHLLVRVANNLGAETRVQHVASTKFAAEDRAAGRPWITQLPFPVHVVSRVETYDRIARNRFVTRYAYHHGCWDGAEREFRGFACVEQWDTEQLAALTADGTLPAANVDAASHTPPALTRTWFHTGAWLDGARISRQLAHEYYREGDASDGLSGLTDEQAAAMELADTVLPDTILLPDGKRAPHALLPDEEREACRALKGSLLRREVYGLDGSDAEDRPYSVSEHSSAVELLQPKGANEHAVFLPHACEEVELAYERALYAVGGATVADPRVTHALTLDVDAFGNVLRSASVAYGRRHPGPGPDLTDADRARQGTPLVTYAERDYTNAVEQDDAHRAPQLCDARTYELLKARPDAHMASVTNRFGLEELATRIDAASDGAHDVPFEDLDAVAAIADHPYRRLAERTRTLFRHDDLSAPLPLGMLESLALPYEGHRLAFTQPQLDRAFARRRPDGTDEQLIPDAPGTLGTDGGYARSSELKAAGLFPLGDADDDWWIPTGRQSLSLGAGDDAATELSFAQAHFFLPWRFADPFDQVTSVTRDRYDLLPTETRDPLGNRVTAGSRDAHGAIVNGNDYRVLAPALVTDPNGNRTANLFDARGSVTATAVMGAEGDAVGDSLVGLVADVDDATLRAHLEDPLADPHALLGDATTRILSDVLAYARTSGDPAPQPVVAYALGRETHAADLGPGEATRVQHRLVYSDGFGRELQRKSQAEPDAQGAARWIGSSWSVYDNKGNVVREYEPFFSATAAFELARQAGVSRIRRYDAAGRLVAVVHPDHGWEKVVTCPWHTERWDVNDTVGIPNPASDLDVGPLIARLDPVDYLPTWFGARSDGALGTDEQGAALATSVHAGTSTCTYVDPLGRKLLTVAHNRTSEDGTLVDSRDATRIRFDVADNPRELVDPRGRLAQRSTFDLGRVRIRDDSMEAGTRWALNDVTGKPIRAWDSRGHAVATRYDELRRPLEVRVRDRSGAELLVNRVVYGESQPGAEVANLRGRVYRSFDGAGRLTTAPYDFKGNLLETRRALAAEYRATLDWSQAVPLEDAELVVATTFDAQSRPVTRTTPDGAVVRSRYNDAGLLEAVDATVSGAAAASTFVANVDYNERGQRVVVAYGNGVTTSCTYDPLTFRPTRVVSSRGPAYPGDDPHAGAPPGGLQDLRFTYDPAGNPTAIRDDALQTIFFNGRQVDARRDYAYDALYRLVGATGREHLGQTAAGSRAAVPTSRTDAPRAGLAHPGDANAMGRYRETYAYDAVGNLLALHHSSEDPATPGWQRACTHAEPSLLDPATVSNRLSLVSENGVAAPGLRYDEHGNTLALPGLPLLAWDHADRLAATSTQVVVDGGTPETTHYAYDANGSRVRKVTDRYAAPGSAPTRMRERVYVAGFETYREFDGSGAAVTLERETMEIGDADGTVAFVETRTAGDDGSPAQLVRYQLRDQLGSALIELASDGAVISCEEYYAYGGTSYQAVRSQTEAPKRYRHAGKERDEESGLSYYGARSYVPWLGRWASCDPAEDADGPNRYLFVRANPLANRDPDGRQCDPSVSSCLTSSNAGDYPTLEEWREHAPAPLSESGIVAAWNEAHQSTAAPDPPASAPAPRSTAQAPDPPWWRPQTAGQGTLTTWDASQRAGYLERIHLNADAAVAEVSSAQAAGDLAEAEAVAREANAYRNAQRAATQLELTPGGRLMSHALEQDRSWGAVFERYGGTETFETYGEIASASGRSSTLVSGVARVGKYAGPAAVAFGVGVGAYEVYAAPPGERGRAAARETGGFAGGAAGATVGTAGGTAAATGIALLLGVEGPPGWVVLLLAGGGGILGGTAGSEAGRKGGGSLYDEAEKAITETSSSWEWNVAHLYGAP